MHDSQRVSSLTDILSSVIIMDSLDGVYISDAIVDLSLSGGIPKLTLSLPAVLQSQEETITSRITQALLDHCSSVDINFIWETAAADLAGREAIANVKNIIAVASGKGGVGKSTTAANIALALQAMGASVGVVDGDIYGPSQSLMLGVAGQQAELLSEKQIKPIMTPYGVVMMGMGNLVMGDAPMAWRGPMATGALQQLLRNTVWPELDYLVVDMPPGTGDIQLTLAQTVPVSGSAIVTTPQDIALSDAKKGIELFRKVNIDVLGIIENMSTHVCSNCGHEEAVFGEAGGAALAEKYETPLLGQLPLKMAIREQADGGQPSVVYDIASAESQSYMNIARKLALRLWKNNQQVTAPAFSSSDD